MCTAKTCSVNDPSPGTHDTACAELAYDHPCTVNCAEGTACTRVLCRCPQMHLAQAVVMKTIPSPSAPHPAPFFFLLKTGTTASFHSHACIAVHIRVRLQEHTPLPGPTHSLTPPAATKPLSIPSHPLTPTNENTQAMCSKTQSHFNAVRRRWYKAASRFANLLRAKMYPPSIPCRTPRPAPASSTHRLAPLRVLKVR